ncbi:MAG TPA: MBL fold metallo-hydrolase [Stellaceae bacterium]|nr:MBL fold metallo-hydrolase [Stellaceae bacterium]
MATSGTTGIDEIADGVFRVATPVPPSGALGGFSFNQYLIVDEEPLLFHTGLRRSFPQVRDAIARVMPVERLRWISFSHFEADECGALNEFLAVAPRAEPLCGTIAAMVSVNDYADRRPRTLADGELLSLGRHTVRWLDTPHLPHAWECGFLMERTTRTLLCGDLFTEGGADHPPISTGDILEPSEKFRLALDYYSHTRGVRRMLTRLAMEDPTTLARMHGSAWQGEGAKLLMALADRLEG